MAIWVAGAPRKVAGENTITKLIPRLCQSSVRRLAMRAVMRRPSTLTLTVSPSLRPSPSATLFSNETSDACSSGFHHSPSTTREPAGTSFA